MTIQWKIDFFRDIPIVENGPSLEKSFLKCGAKRDYRIVLAHPHGPIGLSKMDGQCAFAIIIEMEYKSYDEIGKYVP